MIRLLNRIQRQENSQTKRDGNILVLSAGVMVLVMGFAAFSVDVGYIALTKAQLENAVDAAALAAAMELNPIIEQNLVLENAKAAAVEVAAANRAGDHSEVYVNPDTDITLGRRTWNPLSQTYSFDWGPTAVPYNIVRVDAIRKEISVPDGQGGAYMDDRRLPLFLAPVIGHAKAGLDVSAVATFQPRDMMLVLDYSASMNDDSEFRSMDTFGQSAVEDMIRTMWEDLGSPTYGNLQFEPDWVTVPGWSSDVKWRTSAVDIESEYYTLQTVKLYFSDGYTQYFYPSSSSGTFAGTGSHSGKRIIKTKVKAAGYWETFDFYSNSAIKRGLGLDSVPYPYASGSWSDYIEYARSHSSSMPWYEYDIYAAGYRRKFGMLTLINFWNQKKPKNNQTADLWMASQQPITALKDSTDVLLDYLTNVEAEDRVGLSVYTYPNSNGAILESSMTEDFNSIKTISRQRQAGHYDYYTNIGAGMRTARLELENNSRPQAFRMMVLMTDGIANRTSTSASPAQFARDEAELAHASKIKIMTISLGAGADTDLMQDIADITGGIHFNVPGGSSVSSYQAQLELVFAEIASDRPLKLISID